jgi:Na+/pantothenate symporter
VLTVLITFAVMINRYVFFSPDNQVVVEDRLFGQVMYRRSLTLMSSEDVKVEIFAGSWYVFVTNYGIQPQLITHARADSQLAMELVVMFEEHNSAMPEATA